MTQPTRRAPFCHALLVCLAALVPAACSDDAAQLPECEDGVDNDGDTFTDGEDPSCQLGNDTEGEDPTTDCNDGEDDDGDDLIDLDDPGCTDITDDSELDNPTPECDDGLDNDDDGLTDYPADPGCFSPLQDDETDACPDGAACPQCADGQDNDEDGDVDYPDDDGCAAASDNQERTEDPTACAGITYQQLAADGYATGTLANGSNLITSATCGGTGKELVYQFYVEEPQVMVATTALSGTFTDTVLYVRSRCMEPATEEGCNDDATAETNSSTLNVALEPGYYFLVVDGRDAAAVGTFQMQVDFYPGFGSICDPELEDACAPGLVCRQIPPATEYTCEEPVCSDDRDDDEDGLTDFPLDPGCSAPTDSSEEDTCPDGVDCPDCANGVDDDGDLLVDYPADTDCASAGQLVEGCGAESDPILTVTSDSHAGTTVGLTNDFTPSCNTSSHTAPDQVWLIQLPVDVEQLVVDTTGSSFDSVLMVRGGNCSGTDLACDDQSGGGGTSRVVLDDLAAGVYAAVVDGWAANAGAYQLHVNAEVAPGAACTDPLFASGVLSCPTWAPCDGSICVPPACGDSNDDDLDGLNGFPSDPGCTSAQDNDETDDCPDGPNCPECGNGVDDDSDGQADWPADPDCTFAGQATESCGQESDPFGTVDMTSPQTLGSNAGSIDDFSPPSGCSFGSGGGEVVYFMDLPIDMLSMRLHTIGSNLDTVLYVDDPACDGTTAEWCDDDSGGSGFTSDLNITDGISAGTWAVFIDSYSTFSLGDFMLNISGVAAPGESCVGPLFDAGAFVCPTFAPCNGTICDPPACSDGISNDADSLVDFPEDPGCTGIDDDDETDDCPAGASCPECGDAADNDGDGMTNYPDDPNCVSANDDTEGCESDPTTTVMMPLTTGSTVGLSDFFEPACGFNSGADKTFLLTLPVTIQTLTVDTVGSAFDTILSMKSAGCELTDLACDDNSGGVGNSSRLVRSSVAAGDYVFVIDGYDGASGNYGLNVRGFATPGAACTDPLFATGVLSCAVGQTCVSGTCQ